jgi:hypothetical protein
MDVLKVLAIIAAIAAFVGIAVALDAYSKQKYDIGPFGLGVTSAIVLALLIAGSSLFALPEGTALPDAWGAILALAITEPLLNFVVLLALAALIVFGTYVYLAMQTNPLIALIALAIQLVAAVALIVFLIAALLLLGGDKKKARRRTA